MQETTWSILETILLKVEVETRDAVQVEPIYDMDGGFLLYIHSFRKQAKCNPTSQNAAKLHEWEQDRVDLVIKAQTK